MHTKEMWKNALLRIAQEIPKTHFLTWFQKTALLSTEGGILDTASLNHLERGFFALGRQECDGQLDGNRGGGR